MSDHPVMDEAIATLLDYGVDVEKLQSRIELLDGALKEAIEWNWLGEEYHEIPQKVIDSINNAIAAVETGLNPQCDSDVSALSDDCK